MISLVVSKLKIPIQRHIAWTDPTEEKKWKKVLAFLE